MPLRGGRPTKYEPRFAHIAQVMYQSGSIDWEVARALGVCRETIWRWKARHPEFSAAMKEGKAEFDDRVERALGERAVGYEYRSEKIVVVKGQIVRVETLEHVPAHVGAALIWLHNRRPERWRPGRALALAPPEEAPPVRPQDLYRYTEEELEAMLCALLSAPEGAASKEGP